MHVIRHTSQTYATREPFQYRPWILSGILAVLVLVNL